MTQFRKKPVVIEAITFDELVAHGRAHAINSMNGVPWAFEYKGQPITHENDDCYLIPTLEGTMRFERGAMLITGVKGEIYPCAGDIFAATYEPVAALRAAADTRDHNELAEAYREGWMARANLPPFIPPVAAAVTPAPEAQHGD